MEWARSKDLTLFTFWCVHHQRSFLTKDQQASAGVSSVMMYGHKPTMPFQLLDMEEVPIESIPQ